MNFSMMKSMAKSKGKDLLKVAQTSAIPIGLVLTGAIATQKFANFKTLFPNVDPENPFIKHEGLVKVGGVVVALTLTGGFGPQNKKIPMWAQWLMIGVALQGGIKAVRTYTANDAGVAFVDALGRQSTDAEMEAAANYVINQARNNNTGVAGRNYNTGVAGANDLTDPYNQLMHVA
jgi:hypothetical protein